MGTISLVLGIIALVTALAGSAANMSWIGSACGIAAIVTGVMARKDPEEKSRGTAGLVCGIIALTLGIIVTIVILAFGATLLKILMSLAQW